MNVHKVVTTKHPWAERCKLIITVKALRKGAAARAVGWVERQDCTRRPLMLGVGEEEPYGAPSRGSQDSTVHSCKLSLGR